MDANVLANQNYDYVVKVRRDLHQIPEASEHEFKTTDYIAAQLDSMGVSYTRLNPTGLVGKIQGEAPGKGSIIALRADIDALSITERAECAFKSKHDGFMHACGHDVHAAMLLGAAKALNENRSSFSGEVRLIFQPGEENFTGAKLVLKSGLLDGVKQVYGVHIFAQLPAGALFVGEDATFAASDVIQIKVNGKACHGAMPNMGVDAVVAASAIVMNLQSIASREVNPQEPLVITIGSMHAGTRFNIVAGEADLHGTVRTFSKELRKKLPAIIKRVVQKTADAYRCTVDFTYTQGTEVLVNHPHAVAVSKAAAAKVMGGADKVYTMPKTMGSEDFGEYAKCGKTSFVALGGGGNYPQHSDYFTLEEKSFKSGVAFFIQVVQECLGRTDG